MMYCNSCGKQIADGIELCPYCGTPTGQGAVLAELVAAARTGDQDAISALYEKTWNTVYYTVKSMIKDEDAVFDILQDTYIKAFAHLDSFQGDTKFLPWVRQIAANTARDWLKKKRPMLFTELGSGDGQDTPVEELFPDERIENLPDQVIDKQETKRLLREIIDELPAGQRAAIGMYYYEEMSIKEIAAAMGASESAVKSSLMYGRNKIEKKILELEKQGTKLYSLSPIPFLLLLFRNQAAYAAEAPDSRILQAILASQPAGATTAAGAAQGAGTAGAAEGTGAAGSAAQGAGSAGAAEGTGAAGSAAQGAGSTGAAEGTGAAGTTAAGSAAAAGGLGALKIGLIALAVMAVVGIGAFVATRIASNSTEPQEVATIEGVNNQDETESPSDESGAQDVAEEDSQPVEGTEGSEGENSQPAEEAEEEAIVSYIFSDMPVTAYEVTGLGVGRFESVNEGEVYDELDDMYLNSPFVRLTPGENTFVVFCTHVMYGNEDGHDVRLSEDTTIHSPSGSSQWEAITYTCLPSSFKTLGDFSVLYRMDTNTEYTTYAYSEETSGGGFNSAFYPNEEHVTFAEIYHPDSLQNDAIYVVRLETYLGSISSSEIDTVLARLIKTFEDLGATSVKEIPVEEALERCNVVVSEGDAD